MQDGNKNNLESYIDENIRQSLKSSASSDFTFELMKRVELEKEFAREDIKTYRLVKYIIGSFVSLLAIFAVFISFIIKTNDNGTEVTYFSILIDKFSGFIENASIAAADTLGFAFNFESGIIILLVMACIFLFTFAEKIIFRKS